MATFQWHTKYRYIFIDTKWHWTTLINVGKPYKEHNFFHFCLAFMFSSSSIHDSKSAQNVLWQHFNDTPNIDTFLLTQNDIGQLLSMLANFTKSTILLFLPGIHVHFHVLQQAWQQVLTKWLVTTFQWHTFYWLCTKWQSWRSSQGGWISLTMQPSSHKGSPPLVWLKT